MCIIVKLLITFFTQIWHTVIIHLQLRTYIFLSLQSGPQDSSAQGQDSRPPPRGGPGDSRPPPQGGPGDSRPSPRGGPGDSRPPPRGGPGERQGQGRPGPRDQGMPRQYEPRSPPRAPAGGHQQNVPAPQAPPPADRGSPSKARGPPSADRGSPSKGRGPAPHSASPRVAAVNQGASPQRSAQPPSPAQGRSTGNNLLTATPERSCTSRVSQIIQSFCPKVLFVVMD